MAQFDVYANPSESVAPLPTRSLRQIVGNVAAHASELVAAMDVVVSGV